MIQVVPAILSGHGVRLEPLGMEHVEGLGLAASDGELWNLFFTQVPQADSVAEYIERALAGHADGQMCPWAVVDEQSGNVLGSTRFHDILPEVDRVEIGYTWYGASHQRTHVNSACKLLLLEYAFDVLGCGVVGFRTDFFNHRSQAAIEALGAKKDGVIRHHSLRGDGSVRDSVFYSIVKSEWPGVRKHLETRLWRHGGASVGRDGE
ncbi:MAG: GNAT family N-acetyltransferase [Verrucomicrobiaceae bacterium]